MNKNERSALILALSDQLRKDGSWCGETHVQKSLYILQELLNIQTGLEFILYKHGPFSFDLQDELSELRGNEFLAAVPMQYPFGASLKVTDPGAKLIEMNSELISQFKSQIEFVSKEVGRGRVADLEKIATALYVTTELSRMAPIEQRAERIRHYKPHIKKEDAITAVECIDKLSENAPIYAAAKVTS